MRRSWIGPLGDGIKSSEGGKLDAWLHERSSGMKLKLLVIGRTDKGFVDEGFQHYVDRLSRMEKIEVVTLPDARHGDALHQRKVEGERMLAAIRPGEKLVLLDEAGTQFSSPGFAERLQQWRDQGVRNCTFMIGGAYGIPDPVKQKADLLLSLSPMTFTHQMVRMIFAEQLYRAYSIMKGSGYHH